MILLYLINKDFLFVSWTNYSWRSTHTFESFHSKGFENKMFNIKKNLDYCIIS